MSCSHTVTRGRSEWHLTHTDVQVVGVSPGRKRKTHVRVPWLFTAEPVFDHRQIWEVLQKMAARIILMSQMYRVNL